MSVRAMAWAFQTKCPSALAKLVLLKLCDCANDDNECWPSQARIAAECEMPRETVNRTIKHLVEAGLVEKRAQNRNGAQIVSRYFVRCDAGSHPPVTEDHTPVTPDHRGGVTPDHTEPSIEEPSIEILPPLTPPSFGRGGGARRFRPIKKSPRTIQAEAFLYAAQARAERSC